MKVETAQEPRHVGAYPHLQHTSTDSSFPPTCPGLAEENSTGSTPPVSHDKFGRDRDQNVSNSSAKINPRYIVDALDPLRKENSNKTVYIPSRLYHAVLRDIYPAFFDEEPVPKASQMLRKHTKNEPEQLVTGDNGTVPTTHSVQTGTSESASHVRGKRLRMVNRPAHQENGIPTSGAMKHNEEITISAEAQVAPQTEDDEPPRKRELTDVIASIVSEYAERLVTIPTVETASTPAPPTIPLASSGKQQDTQRTNVRARRATRRSRTRAVGTVSLPEGRITRSSDL